MSQDTLEKGLDYIRKNNKAHAKAKAKRVYLSHFRKSKLAILMGKAQANGVEKVNAQEREARSDPEYLQILEALEEAIAVEEESYWWMKLAEFEFEKWRTEEATRRKEMGRYNV